MYEEMLSFMFFPSLCGREMKAEYSYRYGYDRENKEKGKNEMVSIIAWYDHDTKALGIENISKGTSPRYEQYGFEHLGTRLFVDMLVD